MPDMFCFQCQQTAGGKGCVQVGVCGKQPDTANLQDELVIELIHLARAARNSAAQDRETARLLADGLFTTLTNVNFDYQAIQKFIRRVEEKRESLGGAERPSLELWKGETDIVSLRSTLLFGMKGMAAYAHHCMNLGYEDKEVSAWFVKGLCALTEKHTVEEWLALIMEFGQINLKCMEMLDRANTETFGSPVPTRVNVDVKAGPFIVISGHDLEDLHQLLEQTAGKGINIYTHSEMLPAHYYPAFQKYPNFVGNYGNAWWKQKEEFEAFHGPILMTTNCIVPPKDSYKDRLYTTGAAGYPGCPHIPGGIGETKDFSRIIEQAKTSPPPAELETGEIVGGFAHAQVFALADRIVEAVKSGAIRKFVVMGGCDGRARSREYYTEFARALPRDTVILTAGCAKYKYNKLALGDIGGIPRVLDAGQCNDSYSLALIALKLQEVFGLDDINDLPIVYNIAWYEQKAVIVLLALLSLGIHNIHLGPTLPAFLSPNVTKVLVEQFGIAGIGSVEEDLRLLIGE